MVKTNLFLVLIFFVSITSAVLAYDIQKNYTQRILYIGTSPNLCTQKIITETYRTDGNGEYVWATTILGDTCKLTYIIYDISKQNFEQKVNN